MHLSMSLCLASVGLLHMCVLNPSSYNTILCCVSSMSVICQLYFCGPEMYKNMHTLLCITNMNIDVVNTVHELGLYLHMWYSQSPLPRFFACSQRIISAVSCPFHLVCSQRFPVLFDFFD